MLTVNGMRYEMALIPAGEFQMGSNAPEASKYEQPVHTVLISKPFWLGKTEVTQELCQAVMGYNPSKFKTGGNYPGGRRLLGRMPGIHPVAEPDARRERFSACRPKPNGSTPAGPGPAAKGTANSTPSPGTPTTRAARPTRWA